MTTDNIDAVADVRSTDSVTTSPTGVTVLYAGDPPPGGPTAEDLAAVGEGFDVSVTRDFTEATDLVTRGAVDCVVATHSWGGFDGVAFLEAVRREDARFPVVLVPAEGSGEVARRAVAADATALVPATAPDVLEAVVDAVEDSAASRDTGGTRMPISDLARESERRLKERALDEAPVGITISDATDPENAIIYANDSFVDITGYPHEEAIGVNHRFLQGPETDPEKVERLATGVSEKRDVRVVLRNYTRDGDPFWNQVDISPIVGPDGDVSHYVGFQMDVTERERVKRELAAEREALDRLLDRINGLLSDVTEAIVRADTREEVEALTVDRIADGDEYDGAWLGRYDATEGQVTVTRSTGDADGAVVDLEGEDPAAEALAETIDAGSAAVVEDPSSLPGPGAEPCLLVPLSYRSTVYGVVALRAGADPFDDREQVLLESLGRSVGTSINDLLTKRTMTTDTVLHIGVAVVDDHVLTSLASEFDCEFDHEATMTADRGDGLLALVSTDHGDADAVVERATDFDRVADAEVLVDDDDGSVVQLHFEESPLVDALSAAGGRLTSLHADGSTLEVEFRSGTEDAARRALDSLRTTYERVDLLAYHEDDEATRTPSGFREELRNRLTDRQLTALQKAYASGFFEWPRRADGEQLAASMDIVPSTYHQHLQAAKRKLVGAFFEE